MSCQSCGEPFFADDVNGSECSCGCADEYRGAYSYGRGFGAPVRVHVVEVGGWFMSGDFRPTRTVEEVDAWDARSALKAARYLRDFYDTRHGARNFGRYAICFSYVPRAA